MKSLPYLNDIPKFFWFLQFEFKRLQIKSYTSVKSNTILWRCRNMLKMLSLINSWTSHTVFYTLFGALILWRVALISFFKKKKIELWFHRNLQAEGMFKVSDCVHSIVFLQNTTIWLNKFLIWKYSFPVCKLTHKLQLEFKAIV